MTGRKPRVDPRTVALLEAHGFRYDDLAADSGIECGWISEHPTQGGVCERIGRWHRGPAHLCATHAKRMIHYRP